MLQNALSLFHRKEDGQLIPASAALSASLSDLPQLRSVGLELVGGLLARSGQHRSGSIDIPDFPAGESSGTGLDHAKNILRTIQARIRHELTIRRIIESPSVFGIQIRQDVGGNGKATRCRSFPH